LTGSKLVVLQKELGEWVVPLTTAATLSQLDLCTSLQVLRDGVVELAARAPRLDGEIRTALGKAPTLKAAHDILGEIERDFAVAGEFVADLASLERVRELAARLSPATARPASVEP